MDGDPLAAPALTPTQQATLDRLAAPRSERPTFDPGLAPRLRNELESRLAATVRHLPDEQLFLSKHRLDAIFGCEVRARADEEADFTWTVPRARGVVAHKAIALSVHRKGTPAPLDLVDDALASLTEATNGLAEWLGALSESEVADLRGEANGRLAAFLETWPALSPKWRPVLDSSIRVELFEGRIQLSGKPDLTLGTAEGSVAGKVIVDFKTGAMSAAHVGDMRFYALLDTVKVGTPPRMVATAYLDSGRLQTENVTEDLLAATVDRVVEATGRIVTLLTDQRDPEKRPGQPCRWCPVRDSCDEGRAFLAGEMDETDVARAIDAEEAEAAAASSSATA